MGQSIDSEFIEEGSEMDLEQQVLERRSRRCNFLRQLYVLSSGEEGDIEVQEVADKLGLADRQILEGI